MTDLQDPEFTLVEELRATTELTRTVPNFVREICAQAADRLEAAEAIVRDLADDDPCTFDHHGYCQTHGWLQEGTCAVARALEYVQAHPTPEDGT